jgi:hypothetical protein
LLYEKCLGEDKNESGKKTLNCRLSFCDVCYKYAHDHLKEEGTGWDIIKARQLDFTILSSHVRSVRHQQSLEWEKKTRKVCPQEPTSLDKELAREELEMTNNIGNVLFVAQNNLSLNLYPELCKHIKDTGANIYSVNDNLKRHSPGIAQGILTSLEKIFRSKQLHDIRNAKFFSLYYDESANVEKIETLCIHIRYMNEEGEINTEFLYLKEVAGHKEGVIVAEIILEILTELGINIRKCISIGSYCTASNMGEHGYCLERNIILKKTVLVSTTQFYTRLLNRNPETGSEHYDYKGMETYDCAYFDTLKQNDALEWFLPIHLPGHWILAYIDFRNKVGEVFDSWNNTPRPVVIAHLKLLIEHIFATHAGRDHKEYHANTLKNDAEWTFFDRNVTEPLTPQQQDGYNCGIFVLWFIYCKLSKGLNVRPMTVTPQVLRKEFAKALVNRQLTFLPF